MSKKGQSISINTIIIAAIALAVLVVLFYIFTGRLGSFSKGVGETASCENSCKALSMQKSITTFNNKDECERGAGQVYIPGTYSDVTSGACCCIPKQ